MCPRSLGAKHASFLLRNKPYNNHGRRRPPSRTKRDRELCGTTIARFVAARSGRGKSHRRTALVVCRAKIPQHGPHGAASALVQLDGRHVCDKPCGSARRTVRNRTAWPSVRWAAAPTDAPDLVLPSLSRVRYRTRPQACRPGQGEAAPQPSGDHSALPATDLDPHARAGRDRGTTNRVR